MQLTPTSEPVRYNDAEYNGSPAGKERRKKYRHDNSKWQTDAVYLSKKIVAVDGEGLNLPDGSHSYVMLAISDQKPLIDADGLDTKRIFDYLFNHLSEFDMNVIYGGSYDSNMFMKGTPRNLLEELYRATAVSNPVVIHKYKVKWVRGKEFTLAKHVRGKLRTIRIWDVIPFFQCPFIAACDQYLEQYEGREELVREKAKRGNFRVQDLAGISHYNQLELRLLVALVTELRSRLNRVGLRPRRWDGPGAIATALFQREGIKECQDKHVPEMAARAARFAYAGGRFEMVKYGSVKGKVYEYDINSAYPTALTHVPNLAHGEWVHYSGDMGDVPFAMYRVQFTGSDATIPAPVFVRGSNGNVSYPLEAESWIWSPEMSALRDYCDRVPGTQYRVLEAWGFKEEHGIPRPFAFVNKLYAQRQNLKAQNDGAHVGVKLGLNSMYGKLCQQVGWLPATKDHEAKVPPYHQMEWAGYTTSYCRAMILRAIMSNPEAIIAIETDAVFSSEPLDLPVGPGLGAWELTEFDSMTYVQSGHYYATTAAGKEIAKCRGVDRGEVTRERIERALQQPEDSRYLTAPLTRFYGIGVALMRGLEDYWCKWITEDKTLSLFPTGKRVHGECDRCVDDGAIWDDALRPNVWHTTFCPISAAPGEQYAVSHEFPVEWINPDPNMEEYRKLRGQEADYLVE